MKEIRKKIEQAEYMCGAPHWETNRRWDIQRVLGEALKMMGAEEIDWRELAMQLLYNESSPLFPVFRDGVLPDGAMPCSAQYLAIWLEENAKKLKK